MIDRIEQVAPRTSIIVAALTVLTLTIAAQDVGVAWVESAFVSAGGTSSQGAIRLTGSLGSTFETISVSNGDIRVIPGLSLGASAGVPSDFDGDGTTGFSDFLIFAAAFGTSAGDAAFRSDADLDRSGGVGFSDFLIFAAAFGT